MHFPRPGFVAVLALTLVASARSEVIYEKTSSYNHIVVTEDRDGLRTLRFERNGARQSVVKVGDPDYIDLPYVRALLVSLAIVEAPRRVLVVGLGGGTFPSFLHRHYPNATVDTVEIDPEVVEVAKTFFGLSEDGLLRVHVNDGRRFIEACDEPYDLIVLDAYGSESIPYHLATREFLESVRQALTPRGLVAGNVWGRGSNPLYDSMVHTYREVFERLNILDVPGAGNRILFATRNGQRIKRKELLRRAGAITREKGFSFDLAAMVRYGLDTAATKSSGGRILLDREAESLPRDTPTEVSPF